MSLLFPVTYWQINSFIAVVVVDRDLRRASDICKKKLKGF